MSRVAVLVLMLSASAAAAVAQTPVQPPHLVGRGLSGNLQFDRAAQMTTATATVTFEGASGETALSVDFVTRYAGAAPAAPPSVVDVIVTQHPADEQEPAITLRVNGASSPLVTRGRSPRSIVATIPFGEFVRMTQADALTQTAFDTELEFSPAQLAMLRSMAQRWSGQR